ncbi:hypothetical protein BDY21DRAFT_329697 [Lineolata rhizophorae]|uniref:Uncharacterized protein n=1 Tax=Lineolata rhizophorae TaxID=578093 RepID=A0A6A6PEH5_9PEZI|nr:hypothetical protein BDY21DRAFT_329697 [Lineolata rhizophorae]
MATRNSESVAHQEAAAREFHPSKPRDEPMTTKGHAPGVLASEADRAPEFHAQTLPPGTAPREATFRPNANTEVPPTTNYARSDAVDPDAPTVDASATIGGATSADMHQGLGHPGQGQTSAEMRHDGEKHRAKQTHGLGGVGANVGTKNQMVDPHDPQFAGQRALDKDEAEIGRGNLGGPPAEDRLPANAEEVAAEAPRGR